jgi:hypothetical protein
MSRGEQSRRPLAGEDGVPASRFCFFALARLSSTVSRPPCGSCISTGAGNTTAAEFAGSGRERTEAWASLLPVTLSGPREAERRVGAEEAR